MVAMLLLTIAVGGLAGSVTFGLKLHRTNQESAVAEQAARAILAELRTEPFDNVFSAFSTKLNIKVDGLNAQPDDADGEVAELVFPSVVAGGAAHLREDVFMPALGCPRDLNGDGDDNDQVDDDYVILPVTVRLRWRGTAGDCLQEYHVVLTQ